MLIKIHIQDYFCVIAPFPNNPNPAEDKDPTRDMDISCQGLMWYARPQLYLNCTVCPAGHTANKHSHIELSLVFFSTLEPINITVILIGSTAAQSVDHDG